MGRVRCNGVRVPSRPAASHSPYARLRCAAVALSACLASQAGTVQANTEPASAPPTPAAPIQEVPVKAPEPRYVAPTLRDSIGRIWAPVMIDGKGPFRLVLDTGASQSAVTAAVAQALGIPLDMSAMMELRGVTGSAAVPSIRVNSLLVGDLLINSTQLPIVPDALGGAQGVLGTQGLLDKRIFIDFRHDRITITRSHLRRAGYGFITIPLRITPQRLITTTAYVGSVRVVAIIDTGAQVTIANPALRDALARWRAHAKLEDEQIIDTTDAVAKGVAQPVPPIELGDGIIIRGARITIGDLKIFQSWNLADKPAVLIGMDTLGLVDTLIIDYRARVMQIRMPDS